jgi:hypothetical protein
VILLNQNNMNDEKLLPLGESSPQTPAPESHFHLENKLNLTPAPPSAKLAFTAPKPVSPPFAPAPNLQKPTLPGVPSPQAQSWGVVISIIVIVGMITVGAFYAWGERIAQEQLLEIPPTSE